MKNIMKTCPKCGKETFVVSIFGNICSNDDCFYEEKKDRNFVSNCCSSELCKREAIEGSPFICGNCGKQCQPKQLKNQGLEMHKLGAKDIIKEEWKKDTIKEWIKVFDLDFEDGKRLETLFYIVIKRAREEERHMLKERIDEATQMAEERAREDGITAGMDLVKATYEANKEAWEKEAREEERRNVIEKVSAMIRDSKDAYMVPQTEKRFLEDILKLINTK